MKQAVVFYFYNGKHSIALQSYAEIKAMEEQGKEMEDDLVIGILEWFDDDTTDEDKQLELDRYRKFFSLVNGKKK